ncbi:Kinesin-like protein subito [Melipona quadrifasciata]|uniref:Kinesin-like protein subito n=1 Tax=Melipona quadrifasciata TaxID=166423 RepID=A0A0M9A1Q3_9HYME|nr:Kinesin-like protein subito [Melipona quadrifasciata]
MLDDMENPMTNQNINSGYTTCIVVQNIYEHLFQRANPRDLPNFDGMPTPDSNPTSKPHVESDESTVSRCASSTCLSACTSNVYLRMKPNTGANEEGVCTVLGSTTLRVKKGEAMDKRYSFARIFDSDSTQADVFRESVRPRVIRFLLGESSTVLTYGATDTGKTYTLYGTPDSPGVIARAIEFLFSAVNCTLTPWYKVTDDDSVVPLDERQRATEIHGRTSLINARTTVEELAQARLSLSNSKPRVPEEEKEEEGRELCSDVCMTAVWMSVVEVCNDSVYDLLAGDDEERRPPLKVTARKDGSARANGSKLVHVVTALEACQLLTLARSRMTVAASNSQSHTFLTLKLLKYEKEDAPAEVRVSTLTFCDVAGSRRLERAVKSGIGLSESRNINNSLLVLGRCLKSLRDSRSTTTVGDNATTFGPFRESKLTRMLQKVLSGRENASFIVTIDAGADSLPETLAVLNFSAMLRKLGRETRTSRRNTFTVALPRSQRSTSVVRSPRKAITIDLEEHAELATRLEAMERESLNRECEIRQELVDQYSAAIAELESAWKKRAQDVEDEGRDLLRWSVNQVETFYKERIDSITRGKKRKRDENDDGDGVRSMYGELETENAMITSKVVVLREMVQSLRVENELLCADRNKRDFELALARERLKGFRDLIRIHFPELSSRATRNDANDVGWLVHELKRAFDEKTESVRSLEESLSRMNDDYVQLAARSVETERELRDAKVALSRARNFEDETRGKELTESTRSLSNEDFSGSDVGDNAAESTTLQARVDTRVGRHFTREGRSSSKKVSADSDSFRSSTDSGNAKDDSGIDFSCRSQRSTSVNDGSIAEEETKESCAQTTCDGATGRCEDAEQREELSRQASDLRSLMDALRRIARSSKSEVADCKSKLSVCEERMKELEEENEKLTRMVEVDARKYNERVDELTRELLVKEEDDSRCQRRLENCLKRCASLENQLSVLHLVHEQTLESLVGQGRALIEKSETSAEARGDPLGVQQLEEKVNGLEAVLEECREERNNYRERLQAHSETQSLLETKLKWLSSEIRSRDDELVSLRAEVRDAALANDSNDETLKSLAEEIGRSNETVRRVKEELAYLEETRRSLEERLEISSLSTKIREERREDEGEEFRKLRLRICENEREMDLLKKHRNSMIRKYECMVQRLRIEVEKKKEQLTKLQKSILSNFTWSYRKLRNNNRERSIAFHLQKLRNCNERHWKQTFVDSEVRYEESPPSIANSSSVHSSSSLSMKNEDFDTEESCPDLMLKCTRAKEEAFRRLRRKKNEKILIFTPCQSAEENNREVKSNKTDFVDKVHKAVSRLYGARMSSFLDLLGLVLGQQK